MLEIMIDFVEENWAAFLSRCKESGIMTRDEAEKEFEEMKSKAGLC